MAGFLGTLFMGGVGLRLILPPASAFSKFVGQLQNHLRASATSSQRISDLYANTGRQKLKASTEATNKMMLSMDARMEAKKRDRLQAELKNMAGIVGKERGKELLKAADAVGKLGNRSQKGWANLRETVSSAVGGVEGAGKGMLEKAMSGVEDHLATIWDSLVGITKTLVGAFSNAIQRSTMLIITFGFQIAMIARNFMTFERELINANSIFQTTRENLYAMSDEVIKFGHYFGINYEDASKVLYQFASAGLTAEESMVALKDTLTLTMAVQGDFNTLGKLMVQVIKGFGLEMEDTEEIADKFAYTINKSLIEWRDLSAAVKFAMPFFVAAGQSVDQLLGSLQILTDRALEAGIAGRGLRQAIAQFVEHADDNNAAFRKLGVEILDTEGNMRDLTDIALQFEAAMGEDVSQMDIMMTLMEDLNIRGATAFVHLAQNATEFQKAVDDLANSQGASNEMAMYQQASLTNQIQLLKNAVLSVFYLTDATFEGTGAINGFDYALKDLVATLQDKFIITAEDGTKTLTEFGYKLRDIVEKFIIKFGEVLENIVDIMTHLSDAGMQLFDTITMLFWAIGSVTSFLASLDPDLVKLLLQVWLLNNLFGTGVGLVVAFAMALKKVGEWASNISGPLGWVAKALTVIVATLGGAAVGAISGGMLGMAVGGPPAAYWGALGGGVVGEKRGFFGSRGAMKAVSTMSETTYTSSAGGAPAPLPSYSYETGNTLVVDNAIFTNDNLGERAYESRVYT